MAGPDMAGLKDRVTQTLADATKQMTPLETFAQVGRAASQAATSDVTFGDALNAQKAERIQAAKQMADFLRAERQVELQEEAGNRAAEQLDIAKDDALLRKQQFAHQTTTDAENLALRKAENERAGERLNIDRSRLGMEEERLDLSREQLTYQKIQDAANRQDKDAKAVMDALQTLVPEEERASYAARLDDLPYPVDSTNVMAAIGRIRRKMEAAGEIPSEPADFKDVTSLRKNFESLAEDFVTVRDSYGTILGLADQLDPNGQYKNPANSGPGDLSFIFAYMKMLDPGSTVREGEMATAENARGVGGGIRNIYNKIIEGAKLTPAQREAFINQAASIYKQRQGDYDRLAEGYAGIAERNKFNPKDVVLDFAGPYRYRVMSNEELMQAIDEADDSQRDAIAAEVQRRTAQ